MSLFLRQARFMTSPPASVTAVAASRLAVTNRHFSSSTKASMSAPKPIQNISIFGAGLMGAGIAQVAAQNGFKVAVCDVSDKALENGKTIISKSISRVAKKKHPEDAAAQKSLIDSVFANITTTTDTIAAVKEADLVVEAIIENVKIKQELFQKLDGAAKADCIFATNTSSLKVTDIAQTCSPERRKKFGGLHFFNPVPQMKLVEIVKAPETSSGTIESLLDVTKRMKKTPVRCNDTPGFIVNRLLVPYMFEAVRMVERGDATAEDVDVAMKLGAGYPMGPLELMDFVGLDTCQHIMSGWRADIEAGKEKDLSPELVKESPTLTKLVSEGKLGRKSGEGFFKY